MRLIEKTSSTKQISIQLTETETHTVLI